MKVLGALFVSLILVGIVLQLTGFAGDHGPAQHGPRRHGSAPAPVAHVIDPAAAVRR